MLGLRQKITLGFCGLLVILLVIGIQGILNITRLGGSVDVILRENYRSVIACQRMKEALERIDSGLLFTLIGEAERGSALIRKNEAEFEEALRVELDTITLPGEGEKASRLRDLYGRYLDVDFVQRLRDERRFESLDALAAQMHVDAARARAVLGI